MSNFFSEHFGSQKTTDFLWNLVIIEVLVSMLYILLQPNTLFVP